MPVEHPVMRTALEGMGASVPGTLASVGQQHLDRLSAVDAAFLHQEGPTTHMHIGGLAMFDGPPPSHGELLEHIRDRLHLVPRYRQRLAAPPLSLGRQRWIDDPRFNLEYHVRHTALPAPGDERRLHRLAARIFSQQLDRTKPLWELWIVEGLADGCFALISKTHHSLVDGVAGVDLMTMLFDIDPRGRDGERVDPWVPQPSPSSAQLAATAIEDSARQAAGLPLRALAALAQPGRALADARETVSALGEVLWQGFSPAPDTPLNVKIGPHRRVDVVSASLDDFKTVKGALGGTVNDVAARGRGGCPPSLDARPRPADRGARHARLRAGLDPRRRRARRPGQPPDAGGRAAAGLPRRPAGAPAGRPRGDAGRQGLKARAWAPR